MLAHLGQRVLEYIVYAQRSPLQTSNQSLQALAGECTL
jgi:hypothetical protein